MCDFDLSGNYSSGVVTMYRLDDLLVIEFINNAVLPIKIQRVKYADNICSLWVCGRRLFNCDVADSEKFHIMSCGVSGNSVVASFMYGDRISEATVYIYGLFEDTSNVRGVSIVLSSAEVSNWCGGNGVVVPNGAMFSYDCVCNGELCGIVAKHSSFLIKFSNGLCFDIWRKPCVAKILETEFKFGTSEIDSVYIRVIQLTNTCVRFRVIFASGEWLQVADEVYLDSSCASFAGAEMSVTQMSKLTLIGGGFR